MNRESISKIIVFGGAGFTGFNLEMRNVCL